jgi:hypothetical protein
MRSWWRPLARRHHSIAFYFIRCAFVLGVTLITKLYGSCTFSSDPCETKTRMLCLNLSFRFGPSLLIKFVMTRC